MSLPKTFTAGERLFAADLNDNFEHLDAGFRYAGTRYFFSNGTFAKANPLLTGDIGLRAIRVRMVGGGGGGGGLETNVGTGLTAGAGGGGSGGYCEKFYDKTALGLLGSTESVTVGLIGVGGATNSNGGNGGNSSFAGMSATGGGGGLSARAADHLQFRNGGFAGPASGGDININGSVGAGGFAYGTGENQNNGGRGADSVLGIGGAGAIRGPAGAALGLAGSGFGAGGGGASCRAMGNYGGSTGFGSAGIVIVDCFV